MKTPFWLLFLILFALKAHACIWDAETLFQEKLRNHDLAKAILGEPPTPENPQPLQARIKNLEANPDENNPDWWNNLAGAYIRLGQSETAVKLLEPVVAKFPNDYGIHANLGTTYHLLGRYQEAEKEIARDLEINPDAHFGLEKYHLALLQYLVRDDKYKSRHLFVDEFTPRFLYSSSLFFPVKVDGFDTTNDVADLENLYQQIKTDNITNGADYLEDKVLGEIVVKDAKPKYRTQWDLARDTNFEAGVICMAQMNPKEPACFEMLGIAAWKKRDYNLAVSAFEKAIALGSPKADILHRKIDGLHNYISESLKDKFGMWGVLSLIPLVILYYIYTKIRDRRRKLKKYE